MSDEDDLLEELTKLCEEMSARKTREQQVGILDLIRAGLIAPPLPLEADYTPQENNPSRTTYRLHAVIQRDGSLKVGDGLYTSVSMAASMAQQRFHAKPQGFEKHEVNGWEFWTFKDPDSGLERKIAELRADYIRREAGE